MEAEERRQREWSSISLVCYAWEEIPCENPRAASSFATEPPQFQRDRLLPPRAVVFHRRAAFSTSAGEVRGEEMSEKVRGSKRKREGGERDVCESERDRDRNRNRDG